MTTRYTKGDVIILQLDDTNTNNERQQASACFRCSFKARSGMLELPADRATDRPHSGQECIYSPIGIYSIIESSKELSHVITPSQYKLVVFSVSGMGSWASVSPSSQAPVRDKQPHFPPVDHFDDPWT